VGVHEAGQGALGLLARDDQGSSSTARNPAGTRTPPPGSSTTCRRTSRRRGTSPRSTRTR
jgi:hypothetical protein